MKKSYLVILSVVIISFVILISSMLKINTKSTYSQLKVDYSRTLKQDLFSFMIAYPNHIKDIIVDGNMVYLLLESGEKLLYDDWKDKTDTEKLENPDLQDMMAEIYPLGASQGVKSKDFNPGRIRVYPLLKEVYGHNQGEIEKNLTGVQIHSNYHRFNKNNDASFHLNKAMTELDQLLKENPSLWSYIYPIGGTYNYRYISKTNRLSPHAFGIAIDFAFHKDDYWQWASRKAGDERIKNYPTEIVDIMEKNYFIWGGKWGLFDTLHFEYRPEIIIKSMYFAEDSGGLWYEHLPVDQENISDIICLIEEKLKDFHLP